jgi:hypothetical protein
LNDALVFEGSGRIEIGSSRGITFTMVGSPANRVDAVRVLLAGRQDPYDAEKQLRLFATDHQGTQWACGFTAPSCDIPLSKTMLLRGSLSALTTHVSGPWVSTESGVELLFIPKIRLPIDKNALTLVSVSDKEVARRWSPGEYDTEILGSKMRFFYPPSSNSFCITALTSQELPHPFLENWIVEPVRILLGQITVPRFVARNFGDGSAHVWIRPWAGHHIAGGLASLLSNDVRLDKEKFWALYEKLLRYVALARDCNGDPNFESNPLTRFYEEIINASLGSKWVQCLTFASAAEGIAELLRGPRERQAEFAGVDVTNLYRVIEEWDGDEDLKQRVLGWFPRLGETSVAIYLRELVGRGVLSSYHVRCWTAVRNVVMHGNLVSPWSNRKDDERLIALADLVHRLTITIIDNELKKTD